MNPEIYDWHWYTKSQPEKNKTKITKQRMTYLKTIATGLEKRIANLQIAFKNATGDFKTRFERLPAAPCWFLKVEVHHMETYPLFQEIVWPSYKKLIYEDDVEKHIMIRFSYESEQVICYSGTKNKNIYYRSPTMSSLDARHLTNNVLDLQMTTRLASSESFPVPCNEFCTMEMFYKGELVLVDEILSTPLRVIASKEDSLIHYTWNSTLALASAVVYFPPSVMYIVDIQRLPSRSAFYQDYIGPNWNEKMQTFITNTKNSLKQTIQQSETLFKNIEDSETKINDYINTLYVMTQSEAISNPTETIVVGSEVFIRSQKVVLSDITVIIETNEPNAFHSKESLAILHTEGVNIIFYSGSHAMLVMSNPLFARDFTYVNKNIKHIKLHYPARNSDSFRTLRKYAAYEIPKTSLYYIASPETKSDSDSSSSSSSFSSSSSDSSDSIIPNTSSSSSSLCSSSTSSSLSSTSSSSSVASSSSACSSSVGSSSSSSSSSSSPSILCILVDEDGSHIFYNIKEDELKQKGFSLEELLQQHKGGYRNLKRDAKGNSIFNRLQRDFIHCKRDTELEQNHHLSSSNSTNFSHVFSFCNF